MRVRVSDDLGKCRKLEPFPKGFGPSYERIQVLQDLQDHWTEKSRAAGNSRLPRLLSLPAQLERGSRAAAVYAGYCISFQNQMRRSECLLPATLVRLQLSSHN